MTAAPLSIDTKRLPSSPPWSPILSHSLSSPRSTSSAEQDLSSRCRKLARSFGESALQDDFEHQQSPSHSRETSTDEKTGGAPNQNSPQRRHSFLPLSPPHSEGSHALNEILEEETESTGGAREEEQEEEEGLEEMDPEELVQFTLSPLMESQLSLRGASLAIEELAADSALSASGSEESGLGLSYDQFKMDTEEVYQEEEEMYEKELREEFKRGKDWIQIELSLVDGELLVAPAGAQFDPSQSFSARYVDPLLRILSTSLPSSPSSIFSHHRRLSSSSSPSPSPILPSSSSSALPSSSKPLHLEVTLNSSQNPSLLLQYLESSLQPLHDQHFLTSYCPNAKLLTKAPVIVLISSDERVTDEVLEVGLTGSPRIVFRELKFDEIENAHGGGGISNQSHPIVAVNLKDYQTGSGSGLEERVKDELKEKVGKAHKKGFLVKIGGVPRFPEHERKSIEASLKALGVDYVL
ncbi:uncharacterized protein JCM6883_007658 [Sporobolomyces salmoneus]|uniref:uncharacterized protein n=1 Tax=Sporobolomyces salmoneus TaxID=183962 RepID=UPI00317AE525